MTLWKRKVLLIVGLVLSHLLCIALGAGGVAYTVHRASGTLGYINHSMALGWTGQHATTQFALGTPEAAIDAQKRWLDTLDQARPEIGPHAYHSTRTIAISRLAEVERTRGDEVAYRRLQKQAAKECRSVPYKDCSPETLKKMAFLGVSGLKPPE